MKQKTKWMAKNVLLSPALPNVAVILAITVMMLFSTASSVFANATEWASEGIGLILTVIQVFCIIAGVVLAMMGIYNMAVGKAMDEGPKMNKGIGMLAGAVALFVVPAVMKQMSWSQYLKDLDTIQGIK